MRISDIPDCPRPLLHCKWCYPSRSSARARIGDSVNGLLQRRTGTRCCSTHTPVDARTVDNRGFHCVPLQCRCRKFQGQPWSRAYFRHCRLPPSAAASHTLSVHPHPCSCAYWRHGKLPLRAAALQVWKSHSQPSSCAYCKHLRWPPLAAVMHTSSSRAGPQSCTNFKQSTLPPSAASWGLSKSNGIPRLCRKRTISSSPFLNAKFIASESILCL